MDQLLLYPLNFGCCGRNPLTGEKYGVLQCSWIPYLKALPQNQGISCLWLYLAGQSACRFMWAVIQDIDSFLMQIVFFVRNPWKKVWHEFISSPLASWCLMLQKQHFKINLLYLSYFTIWLTIVQDWVGVVL